MCAGAVAVYSEYGSVVFVIALALAALWVGRPRRGAVLAASGTVLLTLVPWIPQIVRGEQAVGHTKFNPLDATPSLTALRDLVGALAFGENGGTASAAGRWLILVVLIGLAAAGAALVRRGWAQRPRAARDTARLLAATVGADGDRVRAGRPGRGGHLHPALPDGDRGAGGRSWPPGR